MTAGGAGSPAHVALTFDDGPDPLGTPDVLAALAEIDARATFFVVAPRARALPRLIDATVGAGHDVQLHCGEHVRHGDRERAQVERDTDGALEALASLGVRPRRWRTPWGELAPWTAEVAAGRGLVLSGWTDDTHDWRGDSCRSMLAGLRERLAPGGVVLMHDGLGPGARRGDCRATAALLEPLARLAAERGWALGPLPAPMAA